LSFARLETRSISLLDKKVKYDQEHGAVRGTCTGPTATVDFDSGVGTYFDSPHEGIGLLQTDQLHAFAVVSYTSAEMDGSYLPEDVQFTTAQTGNLGMLVNNPVFLPTNTEGQNMIPTEFTLVCVEATDLGGSYLLALFAGSTDVAAVIAVDGDPTTTETITATVPVDTTQLTLVYADPNTGDVLFTFEIFVLSMQVCSDVSPLAFGCLDQVFPIVDRDDHSLIVSYGTAFLNPTSSEIDILYTNQSSDYMVQNGRVLFKDYQAKDGRDTREMGLPFDSGDSASYDLVWIIPQACGTSLSSYVSMRMVYTDLITGKNSVGWAQFTGMAIMYDHLHGMEYNRILCCATTL